VLLVEQNVSFAATVADRHYLLAEGRVAQAMANSEVRERQDELLAYLGV
jgi:branched-chain amino acid transport system ATP-binding protein